MAFEFLGISDYSRWIISYFAGDNHHHAFSKKKLRAVCCKDDWFGQAREAGYKYGFR